MRAATPSRASPQFTVAEYATAGFISAIPQTFIAAPIERAKVLLQIQGQGGSEKAKYNGVLDVVRSLYREGGIRSIFRGTGATLARDGPGSAAYVLLVCERRSVGSYYTHSQVFRRLRSNEESFDASRLFPV